jgi:hypothetical protein
MDKNEKICIKKFLGEESLLMTNSDSMINQGKAISIDPTLQKFIIIPKMPKPSEKKSLLTNKMIKINNF